MIEKMDMIERIDLIESTLCLLQEQVRNLRRKVERSEDAPARALDVRKHSSEVRKAVGS